MLKKLLCTLLCAALLLSAGCAAKESPPAQEKAPAETYVPQAPQSEEPEAGEPVYLDENSEEYRTLALALKYGIAALEDRSVADYDRGGERA